MQIDQTKDYRRRRTPLKVWFGLLILAGALVAVAFLVPLMPLDRDELTVSFSNGQATLESADGSKVELVEGTAVRAGDRVVVADGSSVSLTAADGHTFTVTNSASLEATGSKGTLLGDRVDTEVKVTEGDVRVAGHGRPNTSLEIGLPNGVAGVRGTVFEVNASGGQGLISVHEGSVGLSNTPGDVVELTPGQGAILSTTGPVVKKLPSGPELRRPQEGTVVHKEGELLAWTEVRDAAGYVAEFATDSDFLEVMHRAKVVTTEVEIPLLDVEVPISVRVSAISGDGLAGSFSKTRSIGVSTHWARALALREEEDIEGSLAEFQAALSTYPEEVALLRDLGWTLYLEGRFEEARVTYERGLLLAPTHSDLVVELARTCFWLKDYGAAEEHYRSVIDGNPDHAHALWGLGDVYRVQGRRKEALELVRRALELRPDHELAQKTLRQLGG